ncbi:alpha/beta hydrolase [Halobacillus shinanisalinarum]|uniref:Alpha/beta hydrolase n=1 Tax=Halobacillus shinanisalinarum TaxID=2932258 RepID=A0ABY4GU98_9BACI|nr:alpha/beta fold hydrolase [Halobacillus shinanisalinarum]UOQ91737.1 alpha/beta hydrolase [Halobacillus shinanisalinarum]
MLNPFFYRQKKYIFIPILFFLLGSSLFFLNSTPTRSEDTTQMTPTVFIHGFKGGPGTFNTLLERFEENNWGTKQMVVHVSSSGNVQVRGSIPYTMNPFIQVLFENDRASIKSQTYWLQKVMWTLKEDYGINQVNLVGHSMGGLASTSFLLNNQRGSFPTVNKLVTIGSPFLGIEQETYFATNTGAATVDLKVDANALTSMIENKGKISPKVGVLAIAGVINQEAAPTKQWDGLVSKQSALGLSHIIPPVNYQERTFFNEAATHSGLHEFAEVDQAIAQFLWNIQSNHGH